MGRGVSCGGGQSSLGYLFGGGETNNNAPAPQNQSPVAKGGPSQNSPAAAPAAAAPPVQSVDNIKEIPAGTQGNLANNYQRADGQNCGNFITDRPSTKVHAAPGGGSSLGYLFGDGSGGK